MAEVVICDTKGCGTVIEGEQTRAFVKEGEGWDIKILLAEDVDRCPECSRKLFAKAASAAWNQLKQTRKQKKDIGKDGN